MPEFSTISRERLGTSSPAIQFLFGHVIKVFDFAVLCGHRGKREQDEAYQSKKSKVQWPNSPHNREPSDALDAAPYWPEQPHIRWPKPLKEIVKSPGIGDIKVLARWFFFGGLVLGFAHAYRIPLRWGHDWNEDTDFWDQEFIDAPHFETTS